MIWHVNFDLFNYDGFAKKGKGHSCLFLYSRNFIGIDMEKCEKKGHLRFLQPGDAPG